MYHIKPDILYTPSDADDVIVRLRNSTNDNENENENNNRNNDNNDNTNMMWKIPRAPKTNTWKGHFILNKEDDMFGIDCIVVLRSVYFITSL